MADAGFKIVVEGEKEFKAAIKEINDVIKVNKSELKLLSEQYKVTEQPMETLKDKQKSLSDVMELQAEKSRKIADEMEQVSAAYGNHDSRVMELVKAYNESETELARLQGEYNKTTESITTADNAMAALISMQDDINESNVKFRQTLENVNNEIASVNSELEKSGKVYDNGNLKWTATRATFTVPCSLTLFCVNRNSDKQEFIPAKIFYCKLYDNGVVVKHLVPCLRKTDGVNGFFDLYNNEFLPLQII